MSGLINLKILTPTHGDGAVSVMAQISASSRQPIREAWTMDCFLNEQSISLGYSLDTSSFTTYTSTLNSYLMFCKLHHFPVEPTPDTLSFYVVFLSSHINPKSVNLYRHMLAAWAFLPWSTPKLQISLSLTHFGWLYAEVWIPCEAQIPSFLCRSPACPKQHWLTPLPQWPPLLCSTPHWFPCTHATRRACLSWQEGPSELPQALPSSPCPSSSWSVFLFLTLPQGWPHLWG